MIFFFCPAHNSSQTQPILTNFFLIDRSSALVVPFRRAEKCSTSSFGRKPLDKVDFSTKSRPFSEKWSDLDEICYTGVFGHADDDGGVVFELRCNPGSQLAISGKAKPDEPD